jgi:hypothetical protein
MLQSSTSLGHLQVQLIKNGSQTPEFGGKNNFAHKILTEVTFEISEKLVQGLRDITKQNRLLEENIMKIQRQMFNDNMQYKKKEFWMLERTQGCLYLISNSSYMPSATSPLPSQRTRQILLCLTLDLHLRLQCHHAIHQPHKFRLNLERVVTNWTSRSTCWPSIHNLIVESSLNTLVEIWNLVHNTYILVLKIVCIALLKKKRKNKKIERQQYFILFLK